MDLIIVFHRRKEDLIMEKIKIVGEELKASMKNGEIELKEDFLKEVKNVERNLLEELKANMKSDQAELKEDFAKEVKSMETNLKAEVVKDLTELIRNREEKLKADIMEEVKNVQNNLKAEILKVKTPAAEFIPECPICLHQMAPPTKIVHCVQGHKLCETCSKKEAVKSCPTCKTGFMGRDFGMEAFVRELAGEK